MIAFSLFIFVSINVAFCCDDVNQIGILPPFQDKTIITTKIGEDLTIICCHPDGSDNLSWQDKLKNEIVYKPSDGVFSLKDEKNRLILRIDNMAESKVGEYTCTNTKRRLSKSIIISAKSSTIAPEIIRKIILYPDNEPIQIKCPLVGNQGFKKWIFTRNGKKEIVTKSDGDSSFTINDDKTVFTIHANAGTYKFNMVWCQFQEVSTNGDVKMGLYEFTWKNYVPINLKVELENKGPILESSTVKIICSFKYDGDMSVEFPSNMPIKRNMLINNDDLMKGKIVMTINKITKDFDGQYSCKVTKFIDIPQMLFVEKIASITIDVALAPKIISNAFGKSTAKINDNVPLVCQIKGTWLAKENVYFDHFIPDSSQWLKLEENKEKYSLKFTAGEMNSLTLLIKNVAWDDRGKYRCVVKDAAGDDRQEVLLKVEKTPELTSSAAIVYMATQAVKIHCSWLGYPIYSPDDILELQVLTEDSPLTLNLIDRRTDDIDGSTVSYEVTLRGELTQRTQYNLQCYHKNRRTNVVSTKPIGLKFAQKPNVPVVSIVCSGSSGIVFMYQVQRSENEINNFVKHVLTYAPSKEFDSITRKPSIVIPVTKDMREGNVTYVLRNLVASRNYTFKWEGFNAYGLSNERTMNHLTQEVMLPPNPETLEFLPKRNMINVIVNWRDKCPYSGSNSDISDIVVTMKPYETEGGDHKIMEWIERNFTLDVNIGSAQFLISLNNPQINYEIQVALRNARGASPPLTAIYRAASVLTGSLFSCFPRCSGGILFLNRSLLCSLLVVILTIIKW